MCHLSDIGFISKSIQIMRVPEPAGGLHRPFLGLEVAWVIYETLITKQAQATCLVVGTPSDLEDATSAEFVAIARLFIAITQASSIDLIGNLFWLTVIGLRICHRWEIPRKYCV